MSEITSYDLPKYLRKMHESEIPDWALQKGYNPDNDGQAIVVGDKDDLANWRSVNGLDEEHYPIQESQIGDHIDLHGEDADKYAPNRKPFTALIRNK